MGLSRMGDEGFSLATWTSDWQPVFAWWPVRNTLSGNTVWLKRIYRRQYVYVFSVETRLNIYADMIDIMRHGDLSPTKWALVRMLND